MRRISSLLVAALTLAPASRAHADETMSACISASEDGQRQRQDGNLLHARELFAACSRAECPALVRTDCAGWAGELVQTLPSVVFAARDDGGSDLVHVRVWSDGVLVTEGLGGKPVDVDPGEHRFRFEAEGFLPGESRAVLRVGEKNRPVAVTLEQVKASRGSSPVAPLLLAGLGVALGAAAVILDGTATSDASGLRTTCAPSCATSSVDSVRTRYIVAGSLGGAGALSLGLAAFLFFHRAPAASPAPGAAFFFDMRPGPRGVSSEVGVRF
jgi:hypothetical protein